MNILFLGGVFDTTIEKDILKKSKGSVHYAANKLQWNIIDGLLELGNLNLEILSAPFIGTYPKDYTDRKYKGQKSTYQTVIKSTYVTFNNIWGYRNISRKKSLKQNIKSFAANEANNKVIFVYTPHTPLLQAAVFAKKTDPSIHICLLLPDLPQFMDISEKRSLIYKTLKKVDISIFENNLKFIDSFVLLTEPMKDKVSVGKRPYVVVEGVVNSKNRKDSDVSHYSEAENEMSVVYTGTLNEKFGVINLVKAFHDLTLDNIHLKICGRGDAEDIIKEYAAVDKRIQLLGQLTNNEAVDLQKNATVLVNPRQNNEEFTKYSFPSKNIEYLLAGRPVIAYKLDGIPDDYDNYFNYPENDSIEMLTKKLEELLLMEDTTRNQAGANAREYVLREKNNVSASKRILDMIKTAGVIDNV